MYLICIYIYIKCMHYNVCIIKCMHKMYVLYITYGGLTQNDLSDTICMTLIRFLYDSTNLKV